VDGAGVGVCDGITDLVRLLTRQLGSCRAAGHTDYKRAQLRPLSAKARINHYQSSGSRITPTFLGEIDGKFVKISRKR
jgi:hypothetical protein